MAIKKLPSNRALLIARLRDTTDMIEEFYHNENVSPSTVSRHQLMKFVDAITQNRMALLHVEGDRHHG